MTLELKPRRDRAPRHSVQRLVRKFTVLWTSAHYVKLKRLCRTFLARDNKLLRPMKEPFRRNTNSLFARTMARSDCHESLPPTN